MSDKDFKVKNKLQVKGITAAGPITADASGNIDSVPYIATQYGGTGITTSPNAGQVLYSPSGATYTPTTLNTLDVKGSSYSADAPSNPVVGQIWVESDTSSDSFDPNIIRRKTFTATANQTVFTTDVEFIQGYEQVFFNGMLLIRNSDYTTASNTNVTLAAGAAAGDIVEVVSITNLNSINAVATTGANTITATTASTIPLTIQGAASQSAKLLDIKNNSGSSIASFASTGALTNTGLLLSSYGQVACQATDTGISISGGTGYPNGGTIVFRGNNGGAGGTAENGLEFVAGGTEKMRIDSSGRVGIGTGSPTAPLHLSMNSPTDVNAAFVGDFAGAGGTDFKLVRNSTANSQSVRTFRIRGGNDYDGYTSFELGMESNHPLRFMTNATERMRITSAGNVGIGYAAPNSPLEVRSTSKAVDSLGTMFAVSNDFGIDKGGSLAFGGVFSSDNNQTNTTAYAQISGRKNNATSGDYAGYMAFATRVNGGAITERMRLDTNGYLLVGYTSSNGAYRLQVNSQIFATSSSIATSDGRYKENVDTISGGLGIIDSLRPVSFSWKDHPVHNFVEGKTVGFIAQEVQEALSGYDWVDNIIKTNTSEAVLDEEGSEVIPAEEFLGIAESNIIPLLVAAVKELKARVETLEGNNV